MAICGILCSLLAESKESEGVAYSTDHDRTQELGHEVEAEQYDVLKVEKERNKEETSISSYGRLFL